MNDDATIEAIQERMREVRRDLGQDIAASARDIRDWRSYIRARPWLFVAGAAAIGYLLAPKGPPVVRLSSLDLQQLVHDGQTTAIARVPKQKKSWAQSMAATVAGLAARSAMGYVTQRLTQANTQRREKAPL